MGRGEALSPEQFEEFYAATMRALRAYICRITSNEAVADDILQESYVRLLNAPPMQDAQRRSYLYRVATNCGSTDMRWAVTDTQFHAWMRRLAAMDTSVSAPSASLIQWRARLRRRLDAEQRVTRPIRMAEGAAAISCWLLVVAIAAGMGSGPLVASLATTVGALAGLGVIALKKV